MVLLALLVSLFFLFLAFRGLDWGAFFDNLARVNPALLPLAIALQAVVMLANGLREQILLRNVRLIPVLPLAQIHTITAMGNNVYPMSGGEALRVYLLRRRFDVPIPSATMNVVVARVIDGLMLMAFILLSLTVVEVPSQEFVDIALLAAPIFTGIALAFVLVTIYPDIVRRVIAGLCWVLPDRLQASLVHAGEQIIESIMIVRSLSGMVGLVMTTLVIRLTGAFIYWLVMLSFDLNQPFPVALLTVSVVALAGVISASPGQIGVNQFAITLVLTAIGLSQDAAVAYAIVVHMVEFVPLTLAGFLLLAREGMSWRTFERARMTQEIEIRRTIETIAVNPQEVNPYVTQEVPTVKGSDV